MALNQKFPDQPSSSKRNQTSWSIIWNTELPEKNKIFYVENGQKPSADSNQFVEKKGVTKPLVSEMSKNRGDDG